MNIQKMMKQMQKMQKEMEEVQKGLKDKTVDGSSGGGMVIVKANGHKEIIDIQIKEEAVDPDDVEMLQDLLVTALNDAIKKADELSNKEMSQVQKGMQLPPGFGF